MQGGTLVRDMASDIAPDPAALRAAYLNHLFESCQTLSLAGIDPKAASSEAEAQLHLSAVYTALLTISLERGFDPQSLGREQGLRPDDRGMQRLSALAQLNQHRRLVLLGDPGSGKSTFVNFVTICLAGEALGRPDINLAALTSPLPDDEGADQKDRQPWTHGLLLPVRLILRDFAARGLPPVGERATATHIWAFVTAELAQASLADYAPHLRQTLLEQGGLLLLDGLDEVPDANQRRVQLQQAVTDFCGVFGKCRVLVTSRPYAYQKQDWRLPNFSETTLVTFSPGQMRRFIDRWYTHIAQQRGLHADDAQGRAELLKHAIFNSAGQRLLGLAERPLLLTLMASLHAWRGGNLPDKREELYADAVDLLLEWWEGPKIVRDATGGVVVQQPSLAEYLKVPRDKVREALNAVAYEAHADQPDATDTADIAEGNLVTHLLTLTDDPEVNPRQLVNYLSQRAGLLLPRGVGIYTFPHRTFQEYLAACHLTDPAQDFPDQVALLARQAHGGRWLEVTLLAGAKAARGAASTVWQLAEALCWTAPPDASTPLEPSDLWGAHMAAQLLVSTANLSRVSERNQLKVERIMRWLVTILERAALPARERALAGRLLAQLGDPPSGVGLRPDGLPDIDWKPIPAGDFLMGSDPQQDPAADADEQPQHTLTLSSYAISRYPLTNAQYGAFVDARGYQNPAYWREAEAAGYWQAGLFKGRYDRRSRDSFYDRGRPYNLSNHPVVGVSWYEAVAFCHWLTERLRGVGTLEVSQVVRLPTEAEWERAARGTDGQIYPWGDDPDPERANYEATGIGTTSAVGCFPNGASPEGVEDLVGNVWEWCATRYGEAYPYQVKDEWTTDYLGGDVGRVMRGGWFGEDEKAVRGGRRSGDNPFYRYLSFGFRLVVAPISSEILASEMLES